MAVFIFIAVIAMGALWAAWAVALIGMVSLWIVVRLLVVALTVAAWLTKPRRVRAVPPPPRALPDVVDLRWDRRKKTWR